MATEFWNFGQFVFSFQFLVLVSLKYWQNGLYNLSNDIIQQIWSEKVRFDIVLTESENPRWPPSKIQDSALVSVKFAAILRKIKFLKNRNDGQDGGLINLKT